MGKIIKYSGEHKDKTYAELLELKANQKIKIEKLDKLFDEKPTGKNAKKLSDAKNQETDQIGCELRRRPEYILAEQKDEARFANKMSKLFNDAVVCDSNRTDAEIKIGLEANGRIHDANEDTINKF